MSEHKNEFSVSAVFKNGVIVGYLSARDEENDLDIQLSLKGFTIMPVEALLP